MSAAETNMLMFTVQHPVSLLLCLVQETRRRRTGKIFCVVLLQQLRHPRRSALNRIASLVAPLVAAINARGVWGVDGVAATGRHAYVSAPEQQAAVLHCPVGKRRTAARMAGAGASARVTHNRTASLLSLADSAIALSMKRAWTSPSTASSCGGGLLGAPWSVFPSSSPAGFNVVPPFSCFSPAIFVLINSQRPANSPRANARSATGVDAGPGQADPRHGRCG